MMLHELHESMDIDSAGGGSNESPYCLKENGFKLFPVAASSSGEGLPYAPENWPDPGDKWGWKSGKRINNNGYFMDRYISLPIRFSDDGKARSFKSRLSLDQYIRVKFPDADVFAFFASFQWKIPSHSVDLDKLFGDDGEKFNSPKNILEDLGSDLHCKAGNKLCSSLRAGEKSNSEVMSCNICCNETSFCKDCCCILCSKTISEAFGGYDHIKCEANIDGCTCGHNCHIDCALRAYMAGTVGGSIGLDTEYYCRRCDSRTDLVSHAEKLFKNCESINSRDDVQKILKVCIRVLRGSKKTDANLLLHQIELAMEKLKEGAFLGDIWKKGATSAVTPELSLIANGASKLPDHKVAQDSEMVELSPMEYNGASESENLKELQANEVVEIPPIAKEALKSHDSEMVSPPPSNSKFHPQVQSIKLVRTPESGNVREAQGDEIMEVPPIANGALKSHLVKVSPDSDMVSPPPSNSKFQHRVETLKLDDKMDWVLREFRKSQELDYKLVKEKLSAQKNHIINLYQQLDKEKSELSSLTPRQDQDTLLDAILNSIEQIKEEVSKFKDMEEVAKGFRKVSEHILKDHFGI